MPEKIGTSTSCNDEGELGRRAKKETNFEQRVASKAWTQTSSSRLGKENGGVNSEGRFFSPASAGSDFRAHTSGKVFEHDERREADSSRHAMGTAVPR